MNTKVNIEYNATKVALKKLFFIRVTPIASIIIMAGRIAIKYRPNIIGTEVYVLIKGINNVNEIHKIKIIETQCSASFSPVFFIFDLPCSNNQ